MRRLVLRLPPVCLQRRANAAKELKEADDAAVAAAAAEAAAKEAETEAAAAAAAAEAVAEEPVA